MVILGINAYHGDAAACLLKNGEILAACEEERFSRIKHCAGFPAQAIQACLDETGLSIYEVDHIAISRNPKANLSKKLLYGLQHGNKLSGLIKSRLSNAARVVRLRDEISNALKLSKSPKAKVHMIEHHLAHLASAFYVSPFEEAASLSIDGFGDFVSTKWALGKENKLKVLGQVGFPHSSGIFYTALTQYLGFPHYGDEYKVMALAAFGTPSFKAEFREIIYPDVKKGFELELAYFLHHNNGVEMNWDRGYPNLSVCYSQKLIDRFGPARAKGEPLDQRHYDLAASLQQAFEYIYFHLLNQLQKSTGSKNLCLAGGCAFNSVANGKIREKTPFEHLFIQPAAGDAGTALGSALYVQHTMLGQPRRTQLKHVYLGPQYQKKRIEQALVTSQLHYEELDEGQLIKKTAKALADGKILGWFQGRMEFGPRALGNRSLLADPRRKEMKDILNERIKHRESFRPFAPSILREETENYFETEDQDPFMVRVLKIKPEKQSAIPAVSHVDGTGRVQAVDQNTNPKYWSLIRNFQELTGVPVLLNTSFNENEPIVCSPEDALNCFAHSEMDALAIGNFWVERKA
jgi:carbamoyltransferase